MSSVKAQRVHRRVLTRSVSDSSSTISQGASFSFYNQHMGFPSPAGKPRTPRNGYSTPETSSRCTASSGSSNGSPASIQSSDSSKSQRRRISQQRRSRKLHMEEISQESVFLSNDSKMVLQKCKVKSPRCGHVSKRRTQSHNYSSPPPISSLENPYSQELNSSGDSAEPVVPFSFNSSSTGLLPSYIHSPDNNRYFHQATSQRQRSVNGSDILRFTRMKERVMWAVGLTLIILTTIIAASLASSQIFSISSNNDLINPELTFSSHHLGAKRRQSTSRIFFLYDHYDTKTKHAQYTLSLPGYPFYPTRPRRQIPLYPAEFSDNTQLYPVRDSDDKELIHMERRKPLSDSECVPMQEWQTTFHPSCNNIHEYNLRDVEDGSKLFGTKGFWRHAWSRIRDVHGREEKIVLKTLKPEHNFEDAFFEFDRIDAVAMERLTFSPHVINIFSFCGHSVVTEYADGPRLGTLADKNKRKPEVIIKIAADIAEGLADVHGIDGDGNATFVHLDINPANVISVNGMLKLNDFNIGVLRRWNITDGNKPCGIPAKFPNPQWRSPEEAMNSQHLTEKVDIFSLGHIFFRLICGHEPWNKLEPGGKPTKEAINAKVIKGELPFIPEKIMTTKDPAKVAVRKAMLACYTFDPEKRPSARTIANQLKAALEKLELKQKTRIGI